MSLSRRILLALAAPVVALVVALAMSSVVLVLSGSNPLEAFADMIGHASRLETMVDILNAEQQLGTTRRDLAQARFSYLLSVVRLRALAAS